MTPLEIITERVCRHGHPDLVESPTPLLTVFEFFEGNTVLGSIGCNLESVPRPVEFYNLFQLMLKRADVSDIRIQITAFDDPDWPFTDTVYIMTSATESEVASWFPAALAPDEVWTGFIDQEFEYYAVPEKTNPIACWWD